MCHRKPLHYLLAFIICFIQSFILTRIWLCIRTCPGPDLNSDIWVQKLCCCHWTKISDETENCLFKIYQFPGYIFFPESCITLNSCKANSPLFFFVNEPVSDKFCQKFSQTSCYIFYEFPLQNLYSFLSRLANRVRSYKTFHTFGQRKINC